MKIYLDHNATTPVDPCVLETMLPYFKNAFGNAASVNHRYGWEAKEAVEKARQQIADLIGAHAKEIFFTSGATESDNLAIKGVYSSYQDKGNHIITCVTEHPAVLDTVRYLKKLGAHITYLPVQSDGLIDLNQLKSAITDKTILISIMYANNEIGVIQPMSQIAQIAHKHGILLMSDATQAVGKIPIHVKKIGLDLMALTGHKMYGPKGVGALYINREGSKVKVSAQIHGGGHERGLRSGTLNVPGIVGLGKAAAVAHSQMKKESKKLFILRDYLEQALLKIEGTHVNGSIQYRLPHVSHVSFQGIQGDQLLRRVNKEVAVSSGSACSSTMAYPLLHVLKQIGLSDEQAYASLRMGLGRFNTKGEITVAIDKITQAVAHLRKF